MDEDSKEYGSIIVYLNEKFQGKEVIVGDSDSSSSGKKWHASVVSRTIDGQLTHAAIFPRLPEGKYYVRAGFNWFAEPKSTVSVFGGHEAEVDFRNKRP